MTGSPGWRRLPRSQPSVSESGITRRIETRPYQVLNASAGLRDVVGFHGEFVAAPRQAFREAVVIIRMPARGSQGHKGHDDTALDLPPWWLALYRTDSLQVKSCRPGVSLSFIWGRAGHDVRIPSPGAVRSFRGGVMTHLSVNSARALISICHQQKQTGKEPSCLTRFA